MERNATLRDVWCAAANIPAKVSSTKVVGRYIDQIVYSGSENLQKYAVTSSWAFSIWKKGPDAPHKYPTAILPIPLMEGHGTEEKGKDAGSGWREA